MKNKKKEKKVFIEDKPKKLYKGSMCILTKTIKGDYYKITESVKG